MTVSRPQPIAIAGTVSRGLALHDVTFIEVWEALTVLEPPIAELAARARTASDLGQITAVTDLLVSESISSEAAVHGAAEFFRAVGRASHNQVLMLAQEPLLQLLEPSLQLMIDMVPQARSRITTAQRKIAEALKERQADLARTWMARHIRDFRKGYEIAGVDLRHRVTVS